MKSKLKRFVLIFWSAVFLAPLALQLYDLSRAQSFSLAAEVAQVPEFYPLMILSFPTGLIAIYLGGLIEEALAITPIHEIWYLMMLSTLAWLMLFLGGLLQWFYLVPRLVSWIRRALGLRMQRGKDI